jgi:hypothetical protein
VLPLDASCDVVVAGWASINAFSQGPPIRDVLSQHLTARKVMTPRPQPGPPHRIGLMPPQRGCERRLRSQSQEFQTGEASQLRRFLG